MFNANKLDTYKLKSILVEQVIKWWGECQSHEEWYYFYSRNCQCFLNEQNYLQIFTIFTSNINLGWLNY